MGLGTWPLSHKNLLGRSGILGIWDFWGGDLGLQGGALGVRGHWGWGWNFGKLHARCGI